MKSHEYSTLNGCMVGWTRKKCVVVKPPSDNIDPLANCQKSRASVAVIVRLHCFQTNSYTSDIFLRVHVYIP